MIKTIKEHDGFTLLEVLIAVSILTVGLLAVGTMQLSAIRGNAFSDNTTKALVLAEEKMETLLQMDYDNAQLGVGNQGPEDIDEAGQAGGAFSRSWIVAENSQPDYKQIKMTVEWANGQHKVELASIRRR